VVTSLDSLSLSHLFYRCFSSIDASLLISPSLHHLSISRDLFGFSLVYGEDKGGIIGNFEYALLLNVAYDGCLDREPANKLPGAAFAMFQMMFACITPLLLTGAVAERLKVKCFFIFCVLWEILVFYPGGYHHTIPYSTPYHIFISNTA